MARSCGRTISSSNASATRLATGMQNNAARIAHELEHNLNFAHHGHEGWGHANCNPLYRSIMNYAFSYDAGEGSSWGAGDVIRTQ
jgi:hypothetical protein